MARSLSRRFFSRPSPVVARSLLGKRLTAYGTSAWIVETEAYLGPDDAASHARFGATARTAVMFGPPGHAYVYLCYGVHQMFNIVTGRDGEGSAVLVRAVEIEAQPAASGRGPGRLTKAMGIDRRLSGVDLTTSAEVVISSGRRVGDDEVATSPRIGVAYAGKSAALPLRFYIAGHPAVSRPPRPR